MSTEGDGAVAPDYSENKRAALATIGSYLSTTIAIASGFAIAIITLLTGGVGGSDSWQFYWGIIQAVVSIGFGVAAFGRLIWLFYNNQLDPEDGLLIVFTVLHLVLLIVAAIPPGFYASHHITAVAQTVAPTPSPTPTPSAR